MKIICDTLLVFIYQKYERIDENVCSNIDKCRIVRRQLESYFQEIHKSRRNVE